MSETELPKCWLSSSLGELTTSQKGKLPKDFSDEPRDGYLPYIDIKAFEKNRIERYALEKDAVVSDVSDVFVVWDGARFGLAGKGRKGVLGSTLVRIRSEAVSPELLYYFIHSKYRHIQSKPRGTGTPHVEPELFWSLELPVPPTNEQKRIVSKINALFSRIEEGERALVRVQKLVERYRQSILKAAVTGELTRKWRQQNKDKLESGQALLASILKARRDAWEKAELDKMRVKGITPANDKWKQKYEESLPPDTTDLPDLPEGWVWSCLGQLFRVSIGSTPSRKHPEYWNGSIPWVSSGEVAFCRIKKTEEFITNLGYENSSVKIHPKGTVLLAMIGEGKTRGQAAILDIDACHNQNAASIGVSATLIPPEYVYHFLLYRYESVRSIGQGGNQPALNGDLVKGIAIPVPPLDEIVAICDAIEHQLIALAKFDSDLEAQHLLVHAQRQVVLREAFKGTLVNQDPADEPESVLLEHIAAERGTYSTAPKRGRKKKANV